MKKILQNLLLGGLLAATSLSLTAQCGDRFQTEIFDNFEVTQDVQYGSNVAIGGAATTLKFDFYEPSNDSYEMRPLIILAHGGTFITGDENSGDIVTLAENFARRGYVVASINYRLLSIGEALSSTDITGTFFDEVVKAVADMKAAIRFFRQDAATDNTYRIDPNQVFVGGASAGAIQAIHTAYLTEDADFDNYTVVTDPVSYINANGGWAGDSGNPGYPTDVQGVINLCGAIGSLSFIQAGEAPMVSIHGDADGTVPYETGYASAFGFQIIEMQGSGVIKEHLDTEGIQNALWTIPGGDHMVHASGSNQAATNEFISDFLYDIVVCEEEIVEPPVGINDPAAVAAIGLNIYPNPASSVFTIAFNSGLQEDVNIAIYDYTGREVLQMTSPADNFVTIDRGNLTAGLYQVVVQHKEGVMSKAVVLK